MKKLFAMGLFSVCVFGFVGCGSSTDATNVTEGVSNDAIADFKALQKREEEEAAKAMADTK